MKILLKGLLLLLTLLPIIYIAVFMSAFGNHDLIFDNFDLFMNLHKYSMLLIVLLEITYIIHLFKSPIIKESKRTQWILLLLIGNIIAMPFYWFIYVRPVIKEEPTVGTMS